MNTKITSTRVLELSESDCLSVAIGLSVALFGALNTGYSGPGTPVFEQMQGIHEACWEIARPRFGDSLSRLSASPEKFRELIEDIRKMKKR